MTSSRADNNTSRIEIYPLDTLTLSDQQFLTGAKDGESARIAAELRLPLGTALAPAMVPAVVLIHGSGGITANVDGWAQELNAIGIAALIVDSFTGRGITQTITDQSQLSSFSMVVDAYRALDLLSRHPRIASQKIAVMGFSKGGFAALYSSMRRFQKLWAPPNLEFGAYVAFYTRCDTPLLQDEDVSDYPIRLFHGAADDYVPVAPTRQYAERLQRAGKNVQIEVYEGARHVFDNPLYPAIVPLPDAQVLSDCRAENEQGNIVNLDTGKIFSWSDSCVTRGATVGYHQPAREQAIKSVTGFLQDLWK
jgi:dienelactone hydrolase